MNNALTTAAILSLGIVSSDVFSQETESSDEVTPSIRPIEEISVTGQRSLSRLRLRVREKENEIYAFFNDNNSSDRFDIICTNRRPTGTYIMKRECEPKFLKNLRVEKTRDQIMGIGVSFTQRDLVGLSAQDFENLQNEMLSLIATNPEFAEKMAALVYLSEDYEAQRKAMFDD